MWAAMCAFFFFWSSISFSNFTVASSLSSVFLLGTTTLKKDLMFDGFFCFFAVLVMSITSVFFDMVTTGRTEPKRLSVRLTIDHLTASKYLHMSHTLSNKRTERSHNVPAHASPMCRQVDSGAFSWDANLAGPVVAPDRDTVLT